MSEKQIEALAQLELLSIPSPIQGEVLSKSEVETPQLPSSMSHHSLSRSEESSGDPTDLELSRVQKFIQEKLAEKNYSVDTVLEELIEIAQTGKMPNPVT